MIIIGFGQSQAISFIYGIGTLNVPIWDPPDPIPNSPNLTDERPPARLQYLKPLLTHSNPTLMETLPGCCLPVARFFTSAEQLSKHPAMQERD